MARYIDAENIDFSPLKNDFEKARAQVIIMGQPTADVVEVKHGLWYKPQFVRRSGFRTVRDFLCNVCEKEYSVEQPSNLMNYCPYCGAKMDGGEK